LLARIYEQPVTFLPVSFLTFWQYALSSCFTEYVFHSTMLAEFCTLNSARLFTRASEIRTERTGKKNVIGRTGGEKNEPGITGQAG
jgi:hypothetical protein